MIVGNENTLICKQSVFSKLPLLDLVDNKTFAVAFSGGGCRAYCLSIGGIRGIVKNPNININKIPYISSVSGSSWLSIILSHSDISLEELLLFDFDTNLIDLEDKPLIDVSTKFSPITDILLFPFKDFSKLINEVMNTYILQYFNIQDKMVCKQKCEGKLHLRENWPNYIISSSYDHEDNFYPIEFTPNYNIIVGEEIKVIIHDENINNISELSMDIKDRKNLSLTHMGSNLTTTNIITSSSYLLNYLSSKLSYNIDLGDEKYSVADGGYIDIMAIVPLLRRKQQRIISFSSLPLSKDGTLDIKNWLGLNKDCYDNIFNNEDWNNVIDSINNKVLKGELAYHRCKIRVKKNKIYHIEEYEPEIIFFFVSKVKEYIDTLPIEISNSHDMRNFPNFAFTFENNGKLFALNKIQSYALVSFTEWSFNKIYEENPDFFITEV